MYKFLENKLNATDAYLKQHPKLMLLFVVCTGLIALFALLTQPQSAIVLYQAF
jgi:hypothetical protein